MSAQSDQSIRLLVVDDHELIRHGLIHIFQGEPDIQVIGEAENAAQALSAVATLRPSLVLTDIKLDDPEQDGITLAARLKSEHPDVKVILISMYEEEEYIERAIEIGVQGYVLKDIHKETLLKGVRAVSQGDTFLDSRVTQRLMRQYSRLKREKQAAPASPAARLSTREREMVTFLAQGLSNKEIAQQMTVSEQTIKTHVYNVFRKLEVGNRIELTLFAVRHGLIEQAPAGAKK